MAVQSMDATIGYQPHICQSQRYAYDAGLAASHAKPGLALEDGLALQLELRHAGEIAIARETKECAASYYRELSVQFCQLYHPFGTRPTDDFTRQAILLSVLAEHLVDIFGLLQLVD
ncbi:hypothetical protein LLEC1_07761 [Akanthomyces lecanii]|uniref:Uncharacterized protein n=1 Tax=Cordyceps confragosa TaxID=2714763 RepID=A0A179ILF8_CORDF|nr:hypothetical protein LLEC1_07761 [Akanthomyces lecanii]